MNGFKLPDEMKADIAHFDPTETDFCLPRRRKHKAVRFVRTRFQKVASPVILQ